MSENNEITALRGHLFAAQLHFATLNQGLTDRLNASEKESKLLELQNQALEQKNSSLRTQNETLKKEIVAKQSKIQRLSDESRQNWKELDHLKSQIHELSKDLQVVKKNFKYLEHSNDRLRRNSDLLKHELHECTDTRLNIESENYNLRTQVKALQANLEGVKKAEQEAIEVLKAEGDMLKTQLLEQTQLTHIKKEICEENNEKFIAEKSSLQDKLDILAKDKQSTMRTLIHVDTGSWHEIRNLKKKIDEKNEAIDELNVMVSDLATQKEYLEKQTDFYIRKFQNVENAYKLLRIENQQCQKTSQFLKRKCDTPLDH